MYCYRVQNDRVHKILDEHISKILAVQFEIAEGNSHDADWQDEIIILDESFVVPEGLLESMLYRKAAVVTHCESKCEIDMIRAVVEGVTIRNTQLEFSIYVENPAIYITGAFFTEEEKQCMERAEELLRSRNFVVSSSKDNVENEEDAIRYSKSSISYRREFWEMEKCDVVVGICHGTYLDGRVALACGKLWENRIPFVLVNAGEIEDIPAVFSSMTRGDILKNVEQLAEFDFRKFEIK